jgi:hypothetical protein
MRTAAIATFRALRWTCNGAAAPLPYRSFCSTKFADVTTAFCSFQRRSFAPEKCTASSALFLWPTQVVANIMQTVWKLRLATGSVTGGAKFAVLYGFWLKGARK